VAISAAATPLFRERLQEIQAGAENQAFLVESVSGVETLESMAVEPRMQRRWENQLACYVTASFKGHLPRQRCQHSRAGRRQAGDGRDPVRSRLDDPLYAPVSA
jgi:ABC-type bacteriocin/lantibiotic exporter with double-glycine peptidase domain